MSGVYAAAGAGYCKGCELFGGGSVVWFVFIVGSTFSFLSCDVPQNASGAVCCPAASRTTATVDCFTASRAASFVFHYGNWCALDAEFWSNDTSSSRDTSPTTSWPAALVFASDGSIINFNTGRRSYFRSDIVFSFDFNLRPPTPSSPPASGLNSSPVHLYSRWRRRRSSYVLTRDHLAEYSIPCCPPFWGILQPSILGCVSIYWDGLTWMLGHDYAFSYILTLSITPLFRWLIKATGVGSRERWIRIIGVVLAKVGRLG